MGRHVPWEWAWFLARGNREKAFRRLRHGGTAWRGTAHRRIRHPRSSRACCAPTSQPTRRAPLGFVLPPSYAAGWLERRPRRLAALARVERAAQRCQPLAALADHYIFEARRAAGARCLKSRPLVTLYLSERCNSRCVTCDYWRHGVKDMTLESVERMLPALAALNTRAVLLSGGEPLLNPEWREIAALLKSRGLALWLLTSGLSLAKHAQRAAELFDSITVSLDGTCASTYAAIRGVDAFDKVCEGIRAVAAAGVPTSVRVTLQRANYRELPGFVSLARELGAAQVSFLAVDVSNAHAFARRDDVAPRSSRCAPTTSPCSMRCSTSSSASMRGGLRARASSPSRPRSCGESATTSRRCSGSAHFRRCAATHPSSPPSSERTGAWRRASSSRRPRSRRARRISSRAWPASPRGRCAPRSAPASGPSARSASARCGASPRRSRPKRFRLGAAAHA